MKRIKIMVYTLYVLVSVFALLPSASDSFLDVISYEDEGTKRSLAGNNCLSTADVKCELAGTKGVECAGNLKIRKSDCRNGQTYPQPVVITWRYCNTDTANQDVNQPKTKATFKRKVKNDTLTTLVRGECRVITRTPSINVCKRGATMSLKYEGRILSRSPSYCYAYKFLRVNTEYLPERPCAVTTEVKCRINDDGENQGETCAGNIINNESCADGNRGDMNVQFLYKICVFNKDAKKMRLNPRKSKALLNGVAQTFNVKDFRTKRVCRSNIVDAVIDSCSSEDTNARLVLRGRLRTGTKCRSTSLLTVRSAIPCEYNFIITELVSNEGASFIEIYSPTCRNQIVAVNFQIVRYQLGKNKPSQDSPFNLIGLQIDNNGYIIICATNEVDTLFNADICTGVDQITAGLTGKDTIALVSGTIDTDFVVIDVFGGIPNSKNGNGFQGGRVVRQNNVTQQNTVFVINNWIITVPFVLAYCDPGQWSNEGGTQEISITPTLSPTGAPSPAPSVTSVDPTMEPSTTPETIPPTVTATTKDPTMKPTVTATTKVPTMTPSAAVTTEYPSMEPSAAVTADQTSEPSIACDTQAYITEVAVFNNAVRFIELRAESACAYGTSIKKSISLMFGNISIELQGKWYDSDGFLVICQTGSMIGSCNGGYLFSNQLVDGIVTCYLFDHDHNTVFDLAYFICADSNIGCRYYRKRIITTGSSNFRATEWNVETGVGNETPGAVEPPTVAQTVTISPTKTPTKFPTIYPTKIPTISPTKTPTTSPTESTPRPTATGKGGKGKGQKCDGKNHGSNAHNGGKGRQE